MIDPNRVEEIVKDCLFREDEPTEPRVEVQGIMNRLGFHPGRIEEHRAEISTMLDQLPTEFHGQDAGGGGGWSFLNACMDRNGDQWTGLHLRMDQLFSLGQAIGRVKCQLPREAWPALPGGMPYYVIEP